MRWLTLSDAWLGHGTAVALFAGSESEKTEPDLLSLVPWLISRDRRPVLFGVEPEGVMNPYLVLGQEDLVVGAFGIFEPKCDPGRLVSMSEVGAVLVPARAFSLQDGTRLGRGGGYYDRILSLPGSVWKIGVGFSLQFVDTVPMEAHDSKVDALVSENGWTGIGAERVTSEGISAPTEDEMSAKLTIFLRQLFR
jgi:5-formyltetrahydrofolate cyclo-ligase